MPVELELLEVIPYLGMDERPHGHPLPVPLRLTKLPERDPLLLVGREALYQRLRLVARLFQYAKLVPVVLFEPEPVLSSELLFLFELLYPASDCVSAISSFFALDPDFPSLEDPLEVLSDVSEKFSSSFFSSLVTFPAISS